MGAICKEDYHGEFDELVRRSNRLVWVTIVLAGLSLVLAMFNLFI